MLVSELVFECLLIHVNISNPLWQDRDHLDRRIYEVNLRHRMVQWSELDA